MCFVASTNPEPTMDLTILQLSSDTLRAVIREEVERAIGPQLPRSQAEPKYLSLQQAVQKYGLSKSHLYTLSSQRAVTTRKVGRALQFLAEDLERHFNGKTKPSVAAIDAKLNEHGVFPTLNAKHRG